MHVRIAYVASMSEAQLCQPADCVHQLPADFSSVEELLHAWEALGAWVWHPVDRVWDRLRSLSQLTEDCKLRVVSNGVMPAENGAADHDEAAKEDMPMLERRDIQTTRTSDLKLVLSDLKLEVMEGDAMEVLDLNLELPATVLKEFDGTKCMDHSQLLVEFSDFYLDQLDACGVLFNEAGGYWLNMLRALERDNVFLPMPSLHQVFEGSLDMALAPHGVVSVYRQARIVVDVLLPQTLQSAQDRLPAFTLKCLAANAVSEHPVLAVLTDTVRYTLVELRGRALIQCKDLEASTALQYMVAWLKKASSSPIFNFEDDIRSIKTIPEEFKEETIHVLDTLHNICFGTILKEQAESVLSSLPPEARFDAALEFVQTWSQRDVQ